MIIKGKLYAETPLYRGNARKTLFTRDGDGTHRLVSLAGEIAGTAESLMDAFIGRSRRGNNIGLLNELWQRLYGSGMPAGLIKTVTCRLQEDSYPPDHFFDLRMGLRLDEDRWAVEANANYKMETILRNSVFDFTMTVNDTLLQQGENQARLYYVLQEIAAGRFWFGAGKSKGLGRVRLEVTDWPFSPPDAAPALRTEANHLTLEIAFDATNPILVGWNWGKIDPNVPSFAAVEGRLLVEAMRDLPDPIRERLEMGLAGPILDPEDWKRKFADYLPRVIAIWLQERSMGESEVWVLPEKALKKLSKGKWALSKNVLSLIEPLVGEPFPSREAAQETIADVLGKKAKMADRIVKAMERRRQEQQSLDQDAWQAVAQGLGLDVGLADEVARRLQDEEALTQLFQEACHPLLPRLFQQVDQQIQLLRSDAWIDAEIEVREEHLKIKQMLLDGKIGEHQWGRPDQIPEGISPSGWARFVEEHRRVRFRHITHPRNLRKSIVNDQNFIEFLKTYRERARQELSQPYNVDFRAGGPFGREISRRYGKPYDTVFTRMLSWAPSTQEQGGWEVYIPGSTIKGAFRKRASQILKTLWGESPRTRQVLDRLFGAQGKRGLVFFSDAYLADPYDPDRAWCSMDGVKMDPSTGRPVEMAKRDYLFAYGQHLQFRLRLDLLDIQESDLEAFSLLVHLLHDFARGDIPLGGEKTVGFGWVHGDVERLLWLTGDPDGIGRRLFPEQPLTPQGPWQCLELEGDQASQTLGIIQPLEPTLEQAGATPPRAGMGFISHRSFGGYCGMLSVEAQVLTPLHIRESGEPSFRARLDGETINGWDFCAMAPPEAQYRPPEKLYVLPSRSIRGMLRHIYSIASDSREPSTDLAHLNPTDSLFGWVGAGPNQALMGRLVFNYGAFEQPALKWFKVPYPYGEWRYTNGRWEQQPGGGSEKLLVGKQWRLFRHTPLPPIVTALDDFQPDAVQARYFRAVMPGSLAHFTIRFWNLTEEELQRLVWCVVLEPNLAHKLGSNRYLGFGSLRLTIRPESYLIDWTKRYAGGDEQQWQLPFVVERWLNPEVVFHYRALRQGLNAEQL